MATLLKARTPVTNDSGAGTDGTIVDAAWVTNLENEIDDYVQAAFAAACEGRITLTANTPVTISDVTAATTIRFTPYKGNRIGLYDGTEWKLYTFTEVTLALGSDAADTNYDLFAYNSGGTVTLERLAWSSASARATALALQDGVWVKSGQATRRYLGTYRTTGTVGQTEDSATKRFVWNYYHRVPRLLRRLETTDSWQYTTNTWRQANGAAANQVALVVGLAEVRLELHVSAMVSNNGTTAAMYSGIGLDSTTGPADMPAAAAPKVATAFINLQPTLTDYPAAGYHFYAWLEKSTANDTTTWYGDNTDAGQHQSGIYGSIDG